MSADKPTVHLSLATLRKNLIKPEEFKVALPGSKIVTFPDLYELESTEAEETFAALNRDSTNWQALAKWLPKKDLEILKAEKLTVRELAAVVQAAIAHYEASERGDAGKGNA